MILESIWEDTFLKCSHGFRPKRSCHTALQQIQCTFNGVKWFIEGDISAYFDTIDHDILVKILRKRIKDERFIQLIRKFLKAGYLEDRQYNVTYSGTAQGSIISPILANIYLNELDKYMMEIKKSFDMGSARRRNPEHRKAEAQKYHIKKKCTFSTIETRLFTKRKQETSSRYTKKAIGYSSSSWNISDKLTYSVIVSSH